MSTDVVAEQWMHHNFTVSDGTKLHYAEMGTGTPVILIHGLGGSAVGNWFVNGIAPALAPTNRVIGIDMRGHGLSEAGPDGGRAKMADDVIEFMDQQGIQKAHIGGYSMGGFVTASLLAKVPERFITASFGGSGLRETDEWREKVPEDKSGPAPDEEQARAAYLAARRERGEEVGNNPTDFARMRAAAGAGAGGANDADAARRRAAMSVAVDLSKITFPVIAINGEYDGPRAKTHRLWRELTNFTNVVLPGKGHLSAVMASTIPQQYIDSLRAFITNNNP